MTPRRFFQTATETAGIVGLSLSLVYGLLFYLVAWSMVVPIFVGKKYF